MGPARERSTRWQFWCWIDLPWITTSAGAACLSVARQRVADRCKGFNPYSSWFPADRTKCRPCYFSLAFWGTCHRSCRGPGISKKSITYNINLERLANQHVSRTTLCKGAPWKSTSDSLAPSHATLKACRALVSSHTDSKLLPPLVDNDARQHVFDVPLSGTFLREPLRAPHRPTSSSSCTGVPPGARTLRCRGRAAAQGGVTCLLFSELRS